LRIVKQRTSTHRIEPYVLGSYLLPLSRTWVL